MSNIDQENKNISYQEDKLILESILNNNNKDHSSEVSTVFGRHSNPYEFFLSVINTVEAKELEKVDESFPSKLRKEFQNFLEVDNNKEKYLHFLLKSQIQLEALEILKKIENEEVQKSLIIIFSLKDAKDILVPILQRDLKQENLKKTTINLIRIFELGSYFEAKDILIPLLIESKIEDIEEILKCNEAHRNTFIQMLDKIENNELCIPGLTNKQFLLREKSKGIFQIGLRLMKKFDIPSYLGPHLILRQKMGRLKHLFFSYYKDNDLTLESFFAFVKEVTANNDVLKKEALQLFVNKRDFGGAMRFLKEVHVPVSDIPHALKRYQNNPRSMPPHFMNYNFNKKQDYYSLKLSAHSIKLVNSSIVFDEAVQYLNSCNVIGVDIEWKPIRLYDEVKKFSLIQMASEEKVYIFDLINLPCAIRDDQWNQFGEIFSNGKIIKLEYSNNDDAEVFGEINKGLGEHVKKSANVIDLRPVEKELMENHPNIFTFKTEDHKGLSKMIFTCFGKPLDKLEQCSYWTLRPLSEGQISYAALDAFCLIEIYNYVKKKCDQLCIECKYLSSSGSSDISSGQPNADQS